MHQLKVFVEVGRLEDFSGEKLSTKQPLAHLLDFADLEPGPLVRPDCAKNSDRDTEYHAAVEPRDAVGAQLFESLRRGSYRLGGIVSGPGEGTKGGIEPFMQFFWAGGHHGRHRPPYWQILSS